MSDSNARELEKKIKRRFRSHINNIGYTEVGTDHIVPPSDEKLMLRSLQGNKRVEHLKEEKEFIKETYPKLKDYFASGKEIEPENITPILKIVKGGTEYSELFRLACLTWGVPVSPGYGRRLRFLAFDKSNQKLVGLIGLADPVFNLSARDAALGWSYQDRKKRLVNVMNAYVLGALPPYNMLLGGKLVSALVRTREVKEEFLSKYRHTTGIISGIAKKPSLVMVTTTSSLGRSSIYDRIRLKHDGINYVDYFSSVGFTSGWGHFHIPNDLFHDMRRYLELINHPYANGYKYGSGSNWRLRVARATLKLIGLNSELMKHGIKREIFVCKLASNANSYLRGEVKRPLFPDLLSVRQVGELAVERWVKPRSEVRKDYLSWDSSGILGLLNPRLNGMASLQIDYSSNLRYLRREEHATIGRIPLQLGKEVNPVTDSITGSEVHDKSPHRLAVDRIFRVEGLAASISSTPDQLRLELKGDDK